jgi:tetratricopeptide (TPR) repeat protein
MTALAEEIRAILEALPASSGTAPAVRRRTTSLPSGVIDTAALQNLGLSRRGVVIGASTLAVLAAFVIVRAAMAPPQQPVVVTAAPPPAPAPAPPSAEQKPPGPEPPKPPEPEAEPEPAEAPLRAASPTRSSRPAALTPAGGRELIKKGRELVNAHRYDDAREAFNRVLQTARRRERGLALVGLAKIAFEEKRYDEAVQRAKEGDRAGGGVDAKVLLGDAYFKLEKYLDAKKAYTAALKLKPDDPSALLGLKATERHLN